MPIDDDDEATEIVGVVDKWLVSLVASEQSSIFVTWNLCKPLVMAQFYSFHLIHNNLNYWSNQHFVVEWCLTMDDDKLDVMDRACFP